MHTVRASSEKYNNENRKIQMLICKNFEGNTFINDFQVDLYLIYEI